MNENRINKIIDSAKGLEPVEPNPYLFNKILIRMQDKAQTIYQTRPGLVWASASIMTLLIALNIYMLTNGNNSVENSSSNSIVSYYNLNDQSGLNY